MSPKFESCNKSCLFRIYHTQGNLLVRDHTPQILQASGKGIGVLFPDIQFLLDSYLKKSFKSTVNPAEDI